MDIKQSSPIFEDFLQSYLEKDAGISDKDWLKEKLKQESLNLTDEALEKLSSELAGGVECGSLAGNKGWRVCKKCDSR